MRFSSNLAMALVAATGAEANLHQLMVAAGKKYFGSATDNGELSDSAYTAILSNKNEFGQITPGNTQKWYYTESTKGTFDYTKGDVIASFASKNNQILRCHNLVWYNQLPSWISSTSWTNETLIEAMTTHIKNEVTHYKGQCYAWDVVNEAISDNGDGSFRNNIFYKTIGKYYIPIAFAAAAEADADTKLYYNDYSIESAGKKASAALAIVDLIQGAGVKIDGVGLQGHFIVGSTPSASSLAANLNQFVAKGVEVAYTEVDIRHSSLPANDKAVQQQATEYVSVVNACLQVSKCVGITIWDFYDKYSWIPNTFSGQGEACLWDKNLKPKPAYTSISSALAAAGTGAVSPASASSTSVAPAATKSAAAGGVVSSSASASASAPKAASTKAAAPNFATSASSKVASTPATSAAVKSSSKASSSAAALTTSAASRKSCVKRTKTVFVTASM